MMRYPHVLMRGRTVYASLPLSPDGRRRRLALSWLKLDPGGKGEETLLRRGAEVVARIETQLVRSSVPRWEVIEAMHGGVLTVQAVNAELAHPQGVQRLLDRLTERRTRDMHEQWAVTPVAPLVDEWPALAPGRRVRPTETTVANRRSRVRRVAEELPTLGRWTTAELQRVISPGDRDGNTRTPIGNADTQRTYVRDLRLFCRWLISIGKLPTDPTHGMVVDAGTTPPIRAVPMDVLLRLHALLAPGAIADAFGFLIATGAEPQVLDRVTAGDVQIDRQRVWLAGSKNAYRRRWAYVEAWYLPTLRRLTETKKANERVFHVTRFHVARVVREAAAKLREQDPELALPTGFRPYDTRHSFAARYVERGAPLRALADQMGHANEAMIVRLYGRYRADVGSLRAHDATLG